MTQYKVFDYLEIRYNKLTTQLENWLRDSYNKAGILYTPASPYGQILRVLKELFIQSIIANKAATSQLILQDANSEKTIRSLARISGHNPTRSIAATGSLKFKLKPGVNIDDEIKGGEISIKDKSVLKNKTNTLFYTLEQGADSIYQITPNVQFIINVVQGRYEKQSFTGDGTSNQSYSVNVGITAKIDHFKFNVRYNGLILLVKDHLYDMLTGEYACYTRTGFNGGLDVYFGTKDFGIIPSIGSVIEVEYLLTDGNSGDILTPKMNDFKFSDEVKDKEGNTINMDKLFDTSIYVDINFSSNGETVAYTKATIPYVSRNFVLAQPNQYIYHLKRLNMFSKVDAYTNITDNNYSVTFNDVKYQLQQVKTSNPTNVQNRMSALETTINKYETIANDNVISLYLIPNITNYFTKSVNYFNIPLTAFYLDQTEKSKVLEYLRTVGIMSITTSVEIVQPKISRYVIFVYAKLYEGTLEDSIRQQIIYIVSSYLISNTRNDRIIRAQLISNIKSVEGVDGVDVYFVSKKNEDYHKTFASVNGGLIQTASQLSTKAQTGNLTIKALGQTETLTARSLSKSQTFYDPNKVLGIDSILGDAVLDKDEYAIVRGGWNDRNGIYYNEDPNSPGLTSINVVFTPEKTKKQL